MGPIEIGLQTFDAGLRDFTFCTPFPDVLSSHNSNDSPENRQFDSTENKANGQVGLVLKEDGSLIRTVNQGMDWKGIILKLADMRYYSPSQKDRKPVQFVVENMLIFEFESAGNSRKEEREIFANQEKGSSKKGKREIKPSILYLTTLTQEIVVSFDCGGSFQLLTDISPNPQGQIITIKPHPFKPEHLLVVKDQIVCQGGANPPNTIENIDHILTTPTKAQQANNISKTPDTNQASNPSQTKNINNPNDKEECFTVKSLFYSQDMGRAWVKLMEDIVHVEWTANQEVMFGIIVVLDVSIKHQSQEQEIRTIHRKTEAYFTDDFFIHQQL